MGYGVVCGLTREKAIHGSPNVDEFSIAHYLLHQLGYHISTRSGGPQIAAAYHADPAANCASTSFTTKTEKISFD